jgi:hypothetical protein
MPSKNKPPSDAEVWVVRVIESAVRSPAIRDMVSAEVRAIVRETISAEVNAAVRSHLRRRGVRDLIAGVVADELEKRARSGEEIADRSGG